MPNVILIYDISTSDEKGSNRLQKALKIVREYLHHVQRSVFEGKLSYSKLQELKFRLRRVTDLDRDSVILYILDDRVKWRREILSGGEPPDTNII